MSYVHANGCTVYFEEYGAGAPLLLLPDMIGTIESEWRRFVPEFSRYFHTIAIDLRGHGKTDNPAGTITLPMLLEDLHGLMDTLEIETARVCGSGLGGLIAFLHGVRRPGSVECLVAHGTRLLWSRAESGRRAAEILSSSTGEADQVALTKCVAGLVENLHEDGPGALDISQAAFPVLLTIGGDADAAEKDLASHTLSHIPEGKLMTIPGAGSALRTVPKAEFLGPALGFLGAGF